VDDTGQRRQRMREWASLMQRLGLDVPPSVQQAGLATSGLGSFGGYAAQPSSPARRASPPPAPIGGPRWPGFGPDSPKIGPGAAPAETQPPARRFPVRNAPWES
jgi:hypothetical protein